LQPLGGLPERTVAIVRIQRECFDQAIPGRNDKEARFGAAMRWWGQADPLIGGLGERYFVDHRELDVGRLDLGHCLRYHGSRRAVVALMTDAGTGEPVGVHRTFLDVNGRKVERKMLGQQAVVRITTDDAVTGSLGITEGVEDALAVVLSDGRRCGRPPARVRLPNFQYSTALSR
jgi:hypothetical protein